MNCYQSYWLVWVSPVMASISPYHPNLLLSKVITVTIRLLEGILMIWWSSFVSGLRYIPWIHELLLCPNWNHYILQIEGRAIRIPIQNQSLIATTIMIIIIKWLTIVIIRSKISSLPLKKLPAGRLRKNNIKAFLVLSILLPAIDLLYKNICMIWYDC